MEISFCKLRCKEVINVCDGKNLGNMTDIIIDTCCGRVLGIIVPCTKSIFGIFKNNNEIFIPYNRICKIGKDIILVDIIMQEPCNICTTNNIKENTNEKDTNQSSNQSFNIQSILKSINDKNSK